MAITHGKLVGELLAGGSAKKKPSGATETENQTTENQAEAVEGIDAKPAAEGDETEAE